MEKCNHVFKLWQGRGFLSEYRCIKCMIFKKEVDGNIHTKEIR